MDNFGPTSPTFILEYIFEAPSTMTVQEEYYVMPALDLVGVIGGNLGIFIGFSFLDFLYTILDYFKILFLKLIGNHLVHPENHLRMVFPSCNCFIAVYFFLN